MQCVELKQTTNLPNNCIPYNCTYDNNVVKTTIKCTPPSLFNRTLNGEINDKWEIYYDESAKSYYYYNADTGEATWNPPLKVNNKKTTSTFTFAGKRRKPNKSNNKKKRKGGSKKSRH